MKVIHNLIVTSFASVSAQKLHSRVRVLKNSTCECAREMLAHYENLSLECECVRLTQTRKCELALNLYRIYSVRICRCNVMVPMTPNKVKLGESFVNSYV